MPGRARTTIPAALRTDVTAPWNREEILGDGNVNIPCLDVELSLDTIYHRVDLATIAEPNAMEYDV